MSLVPPQKTLTRSKSVDDHVQLYRHSSRRSSSLSAATRSGPTMGRRGSSPLSSSSASAKQWGKQQKEAPRAESSRGTSASGRPREYRVCILARNSELFLARTDGRQKKESWCVCVIGQEVEKFCWMCAVENWRLAREGGVFDIWCVSGWVDVEITIGWSNSFGGWFWEILMKYMRNVSIMLTFYAAPIEYQNTVLSKRLPRTLLYSCGIID